MQENVNSVSSTTQLESFFQTSLNVKADKIKRSEKIDGVVTLRCHVKDVSNKEITLLHELSLKERVADLFLKRSGAGITVFLVINPY